MRGELRRAGGADRGFREYKEFLGKVCNNSRMTVRGGESGWRWGCGFVGWPDTSAFVLSLFPGTEFLRSFEGLVFKTSDVDDVTVEWIRSILRCVTRDT